MSLCFLTDDSTLFHTPFLYHLNQRVGRIAKSQYNRVTARSTRAMLIDKAVSLWPVSITKSSSVLAQANNQKQPVLL